MEGGGGATTIDGCFGRGFLTDGFFAGTSLRDDLAGAFAGAFFGFAPDAAFAAAAGFARAACFAGALRAAVFFFATRFFTAIANPFVQAMGSVYAILAADQNTQGWNLMSTSSKLHRARALVVLPAVALLAAFALAPAAQVAAKFRSVTRVGLSEAEFRAANAQYFAQGMRLVDLTVAEDKGLPVIGAIWYWQEGMPVANAERVKTLQSQVYLRQDQATLTSLGQKLAAQGQQPEVVDAFGANGKTWFATVFSPPGEGPLQLAGVFLTGEQVAGMRAQVEQQKLDLVRLDAYVDDKGKGGFLPVFAPRPKTRIENASETSVARMKAQSANFALKKLSPLSISTFEAMPGDATSLTWFATFDESSAGRELLLDRSAAELRKDLAAKLVGDGAEVLDIDSVETAGGVRYSAVLKTARKRS